jgi:cytochrome c oxidase subunit II
MEVKTWKVAIAFMLALAALSPARGDSAGKTIDITAKRFEFSPNKVMLKKGETVTLRLTAEDVVHGLFVRPLKIDTDIEPGKTTEVTVTPQTIGTFTAICHHFCGSGHGNMKMTFEVVE